MGDKYPDYDRRKEWNSGDAIPVGGPLKFIPRTTTPIVPQRETGQGTQISPKVYWKSYRDVEFLKDSGLQMENNPEKFLKATEDFVIQEAQKLKLGITHIWIR